MSGKNQQPDNIHNLFNHPVIPSVNHRKELLIAMQQAEVEWIMLKLGDINSLPQLVRAIHQAGKKVMVHQDSIKGIAKDKMGIKFMANCFVDCIITNRAACIKAISEAGMISALGLFVIDSEACRTGMAYIKEYQPDLITLMPGSIPDQIIEKIKNEVANPFILGGLITELNQVHHAIKIGAAAVASSQRELWNG
ncbi:glycerol-3-phosphate responsive antiterminator [Eubacteriaceae bacterium ES2]|nr:glycerol-3-phosphate responsive antiterminator [Eubacteriaceae bacterium ES2]